MKILSLLLTVLFSFSLFAQSGDSKTVRIYPGGVDEDNLEVQETLPQPYSDVNKSAIVKQVYESLVSKSEDSSNN
ncbi:MAG: hypothetical protein MK008_13990 [Bdellovibrionales bacterium]|nr:hypothetical protein [Bdellovibrionales bacterium]